VDVSTFLHHHCPFLSLHHLFLHARRRKLCFAATLCCHQQHQQHTETFETFGHARHEHTTHICTCTHTHARHAMKNWAPFLLSGLSQSPLISTLTHPTSPFATAFVPSFNTQRAHHITPLPNHRPLPSLFPRVFCVQGCAAMAAPQTHAQLPFPMMQLGQNTQHTHNTTQHTRTANISRVCPCTCLSEGGRTLVPLSPCCSLLKNRGRSVYKAS
jgi:hypothetical protein